MTKDFNVDQIKKLWILDLIIQSGSLRKAAHRAKVSPSAISQSLSSLENSVGKPLVLRSKGDVSPTPEAISILEIVRPAFEAFERLKDINNVTVPKISWMNFGTYESISLDVLPGLVSRLRETMPHLRLGMRISRTANLLSMIRKGELCSALISEVDDLDRFYSKTVYEDRLGFYVSNRGEISQLGWKATEKFGLGTLTPERDGLPRYFVRFMKQIGTLKPTVYSDSFEALRQAAAQGVLVAVLPARVARRQNDLLEIFPSGTANLETGAHKILMVGQTKCDIAEVDYLAQEVSRLLNRI